MKDKVTVIKCDFCSNQIEKSTPAVQADVLMESTAQMLHVEIRVSWPGTRRFTADVCVNCVLLAATIAVNGQLGEVVEAKAVETERE